MPLILEKRDVLSIENTLYSPREEELKTRRIFRIKGDDPEYAEFVGYDVYNRKGSAKVLAHGAAAKDVPFVGDEMKTYSQKVFTIATGLRFTKAERDAWFTQIWQVPGARQETSALERRNAAFPEEISRRLIRMFSIIGDTVVDPFLGTGTTMKVAKELHRSSIGYEIDDRLVPCQESWEEYDCR